MITIIKGARVYTPEYLGQKDVLLVGDKIAYVGENISLKENSFLECSVINGENKILTPGFIDSHVHILGGGGEGGFKTRTPEITLSEITTGGVTTVIGCLGTDGISRNMISLLAKARGLEEEGISTYIYSGSYRVPTTTITGDVMKDIVVVDKIIGVGEIALSDHRSSQPTCEELKRLAADVRVAGMLAGKAGIINIHLGDSMRMMDLLFEIIEKTEIPFTQFLPTHTNRSEYLFEEAVRYAKAGGTIDFTTSSDPLFWDTGEVKASRGLKKCLDQGIPDDRITFSSDAQGSLPLFNEKQECIGLGVGKVKSLFDEVKDAIFEDGVPFEKAIKVITLNPATILKLTNKGRIQKNSDADLVLLDEKTLEIDTVVAKGNVMVQDKKVKVIGTFEQQ